MEPLGCSAGVLALPAHRSPPLLTPVALSPPPRETLFVWSNAFNLLQSRMYPNYHTSMCCSCVAAIKQHCVLKPGGRREQAGRRSWGGTQDPAAPRVLPCTQGQPPGAPCAGCRGPACGFRRDGVASSPHPLQPRRRSVLISTWRHLTQPLGNQLAESNSWRLPKPRISPRPDMQ